MTEYYLIVAAVIFLIGFLIFYLSFRIFTACKTTFLKTILMFLSFALIPYFLFAYLSKKNYQKSWSKSFLFFVSYLLISTIVTVCSAFVTHKYFLVPFIVDGSSMSPSLDDGDYVVVKKYDKSFNKGDIVFFNAPDNPNVVYVKRIVALPGDSLKIESGKVLVNNNEVQSYTTDQTEGNQELKLSNDQYFTLGDNRMNSKDSRKYGPISKEEIIGKLLLKIEE